MSNQIVTRQWLYQIFTKYPELGKFYREQSKEIIAKSSEIKELKLSARQMINTAIEKELAPLKKEILEVYKQNQKLKGIRKGRPQKHVD
jgi:hypothetical protein